MWEITLQTNEGRLSTKATCYIIAARTYQVNMNHFSVYIFQTVALGGLVVSVLATGPKVRGFDPDRGR